VILKACLETYAALDYRKVHLGTRAAVGISISQLATKRWSNFPGLEWQGKEVKGDMKLRTVIKKESATSSSNKWTKTLYQDYILLQTSVRLS